MDIRSHIDRYSPLNWSLKYRVMVFLALVLVLMPAAIFATSDTFSDVPDSSPFHDDINAIFGARITNGTSPGIYSPGLNVTREQMAIFLHRGLPRVAYDTRVISDLPDFTSQDLGVVTIRTGGAPGGTGFVKLDASIVSGTDSTTGCPCLVTFWIQQDGSENVTSIFSGTTIYNKVPDSIIASTTSGSLTWAVAVPTASTLTFRLKASKVTTTASVVSRGALTALYVPFGSAGGNTLNPPAMAAQAVSDAQDIKAQTSKRDKEQ